MAHAAAKISFVSLGCPEALVDSERILTRLRAEGYELTRGHRGADIVIVDTSGFLESAQASRRPLRVSEVVTARIERADVYDPQRHRGRVLIGSCRTGAIASSQ
jgi:tRNA A37 methylthiotransferase MiaB